MDSATRQQAIDLYDRFTHDGMGRRDFMGRMIAIAGSVAAAEALIAGIAASPAAAAVVPENDSRLTIGMQKLAGGYSGYVAVHDGFCYVDSRCSGLYDAVMAAATVTERLLVKAAAGSEAFAAEVAALSAADKAAFKHAEDICNFCAPSCLIGSGFLGRGGY